MELYSLLNTGKRIVTFIGKSPQTWGILQLQMKWWLFFSPLRGATTLLPPGGGEAWTWRDDFLEPGRLRGTTLGATPGDGFRLSGERRRLETPRIKLAWRWRAKRKKKLRPLLLNTYPSFSLGVVCSCQGCAHYLAASTHLLTS